MQRALVFNKCSAAEQCCSNWVVNLVAGGVRCVVVDLARGNGHVGAGGIRGAVYVGFSGFAEGVLDLAAKRGVGVGMEKG
jgi:hypothetical protein